MAIVLYVSGVMIDPSYSRSQCSKDHFCTARFCLDRIRIKNQKTKTFINHHEQNRDQSNPKQKSKRSLYRSLETQIDRSRKSYNLTQQSFLDHTSSGTNQETKRSSAKIKIELNTLQFWSDKNLIKVISKDLDQIRKRLIHKTQKPRKKDRNQDKNWKWSDQGSDLKSEQK